MGLRHDLPELEGAKPLVGPLFGDLSRPQVPHGLAGSPLPHLAARVDTGHSMT
jgi:hypothetical protein